MDRKYITAEDWAQFEKKHYPAYMWLLNVSINREFEHLKSLPHLNDWQFKRLSDMCEIRGLPIPERVQPREHPNDVLR